MESIISSEKTNTIIHFSSSWGSRIFWGTIYRQRLLLSEDDSQDTHHQHWCISGIPLQRKKPPQFPDYSESVLPHILLSAFHCVCPWRAIYIFIKYLCINLIHQFHILQKMHYLVNMMKRFMLQGTP